MYEPLFFALRVAYNPQLNNSSDLYAAGFDWYLWEVISTNKLASTRLDDVVEEDFADRVVATAWFTVVKNGKEGGVKLIVENRITCLPDGAAKAGAVSDNLKTGDVERYHPALLSH